jgi:hypothetical protein
MNFVHEGETKMQSFLYRQVSLVVGVIALAFTVYFYLTEPGKHTEELSHANDTAIQLMEARIIGQRTTIDELTKIQQNDTKELKNEVAGLRVEMQAGTNQLVKIQTILEERLPQKR